MSAYYKLVAVDTQQAADDHGLVIMIYAEVRIEFLRGPSANVTGASLLLE